MLVRALIIGSALLFPLVLSAGPASAQSYSDVLGKDQSGSGGADPARSSVADPARSSVADPAATAASLPNTGSPYAVPLTQAATVLIGGGTLLVLGTRRHRNARRRPTVA